MKNEHPELTTLQEYLLYYGGRFRIRRSRIQKAEIENFITNQFEQNGYIVTKDKAKLNKSNTKIIIAGDLYQSDRVYLCPYDTPLRTLQKQYCFYPFDDQKNKKQEIKDMLLSSSILVAGLLLTGGLYYLITHHLDFILLFLLWGYMLVFHYLLENKDNFNKSSASLALLTYISKTTKHACYIFIDNNAVSNLGLKALYGKYRNILRDKQVLYVDCISYGKDLMLAFSEQCRNKVEPATYIDLIEKQYGENASSFHRIDDQLQVLISGSLCNDALSIDHIRNKNDRKVDMNRLLKLAQWLG